MTGAIDPNATYDAAEVARLLFHVSLRTFNRNRRKLARKGFPAPVRDWGKKVWSGAALLAWRDREPPKARQDVIDLTPILAERARALATR